MMRAEGMHKANRYVRGLIGGEAARLLGDIRGKTNDDGMPHSEAEIRAQRVAMLAYEKKKAGSESENSA